MFYPSPGGEGFCIKSASYTIFAIKKWAGRFFLHIRGLLLRDAGAGYLDGIFFQAAKTFPG